MGQRLTNLPALSARFPSLRLVTLIGGIAALIAALFSPLHALSERLFSAHMMQHLLIIVVAAPLLVLSIPSGPLKRLPRPARILLARLYRLKMLLTHPVTAWGLHVGVLYLWHIPALYEAAAQHGWLHAMEHWSFLASGLLYWWSLLDLRGSTAGSLGVGILSLFAMMVQCSLLGALITFAPAPWYRIYSTSPVGWGLSPLEDQQLAGLVMWIPAGAIYTVAAIWLGAAWFSVVEERSLKRAELKAQQKRMGL